MFNIESYVNFNSVTHTLINTYVYHNIKNTNTFKYVYSMYNMCIYNLFGQLNN